MAAITDIDRVDMPDIRPRRVAFLGDVHMNTRWTVAAVHEARRLRADVIVQLGDFGYSFDPRFLDDVSDALRAAHLQMIFVDGNHEDHRMLRTAESGNAVLRRFAPHILHAGRGYRWTWDGVRFLALGGAHSVDRRERLRYGWMWHQQETLTAGQIQDAVAGGPTDVLISHDCPQGVEIPGLQPDAFPADEIARSQRHRGLLRTVVDQVRPARIYHGHYHVAYHQAADFGYGPVQVTGLSCDGTSWPEALLVVDMAALKAATAPQYTPLKDADE